MMIQWCSAMARRLLTSQKQPSTTMMMQYHHQPSSSSSVSATNPIVCGRGDKRTKRGKRSKGSYGNARPKKKQMIQRFKDKVEVPRSTPWPLPFKLI